MKMPAWTTDTIARRFAVTEILAVTITLALLSLFNTVGGVWSHKPISETGVLNEAADIVNIVEAVPASQRLALVKASSNKRVSVYWYPAVADVSIALDSVRSARPISLLDTFTAQTKRPSLRFSQRDHADIPPGLVYVRYNSAIPYILAVQLAGADWLVFTLPPAEWGPPLWVQWAIRLAFFVIALVLVTHHATRRFSRPIEQLASAVRQFGISPQAPPLAADGPRELREVIATFNDMKAQIQNFLSYRVTMLAAISHDLRTPLTRLRLRGEYIQDPLQQAKLFRDVDEMQAMVDGALAFFRDDTSTEKVRVFDLAGMLEALINDYTDQGVEIIYTGPHRAPYRGRMSALKRAFANVIDNAIRYATPPTIELSLQEAAWIVSVLDRGPGIPAQSFESVFRPYVRLEQSRNRSTGGIGLGLTAALAAVRSHGGEIVLKNRIPLGLQVSIRLPVSTVDEPRLSILPAPPDVVREVQ
jgi:signal transduction histidine kinase